jgi:excinuclease UvrABC nuclease subunit
MAGRMDAARKLVFPRAAAEPGVYRFEVDGDEASVYFGEARDLQRRFQRYRDRPRGTARSP